MTAQPLAGLVRFCRQLRGKFILLISALLITSSMSLGWIFLVREVRDQAEKLSQKGTILARNLAANAELGVYSRNPEALAVRGQALLKEGDVAFVAILDNSGEPLFSGTRSGLPLPPLSRMFRESFRGLPSQSMDGGEVKLYREPRKQEEFYLFLFPVLTRTASPRGEEIGFLPDLPARPESGRERIGSIIVGLTTEPMRSSVHRLERALGLATLVVIAIGIVLTVFLVRIIGEPVHQLVEATRRIAEGDLDILLHPSSEDEIGELARSFNQMTLKLRSSREELERNNLQLEQKVRDRTRELQEAQNQLVQAEKMSVVGQLISGVAHELNNPLAGVLGYSQLLLRLRISDEVKRGLEKIESEADRCKRIVQNLLIFARKDKPQKRPVDLNGVVESVLELKAYQLKVGNVRVEKDLQPGLPRTMADSGQLQQVLMNIFHNAQQAMNETGREGVLTIRTLLDGETIHLEVRDTGTGIAPENLGRVFDPFFTTKEVGQGTGLGLSICYGIIQEHKGKIWADSRRGEGTTFHILIPVQGEAESSRGREAAVDAPAAPAEITNHHGPARILVVDDEASIVDILYDILRLDGHNIETALNGRLALKKLEQEPFDVVISDLRMPGMSGQELYERMKEVDSNFVRRVIFTTGDVASQETQGFLRESGSPYLQKPFDLSEVRRLVQQVLAGSQSHRPELPWVSPDGPLDPDPSA